MIHIQVSMGGKFSGNKQPRLANSSKVGSGQMDLDQQYSKDTKTKWNDDDEVYQNKNMAHSQDTQALLNLLSLQVKAIQKMIKLNQKDSQVIPTMVTIKSDSLSKTGNEVEFAKTTKSSRPGIDLICVIDVSGSMSGIKIDLVKQSLKYILELLGQSDRLSLVTFESFAERLFPLLKVNAKNMAVFESAINMLSGRGGTSIAAGMELAFKTLRQKKYKNNVESVFLLSDGLDSGAHQTVTNMLNSDIALLKSSAFTVHTFGYGNDHDPLLMKNIANLRDGNFFYIQKLDTLDEAVANCMGGLFSVLAEQINITVKSELKGVFSDVKITKAFGDISIYNTDKNQYNIKLSQFLSGTSKNFVFQVTIPAISQDIGDLDRSQVLVTAVATIKPVGKIDNTELKSSLLVTFLNHDQQLKEVEADPDVIQNHIRVNTVEVMKQNLKLMAEKKYDQVQKNIDSSQQKINSYKNADKSSKLNMLRGDMQKMKAQLECQDYVGGMNFMMENERAHSRERNFGYQNSCQKQMVQGVRSKKSKY